MIAARSGRTDITNILLEGENVELDVCNTVCKYRNECCLFNPLPVCMCKQGLVCVCLSVPTVFPEGKT